MKLLWFFPFCFFAIINTGEAAQYYGKSLGKLSEFHHGVSGHVYAVDGRTLFIKDLTYDGEGPAAFFYVGNTKAPSNNGAIRLKDERGSSGVLKRYNKKSIVLSLPEGKTFHSIRWFSIWCDEFSVNFGDVKIPKNLDFPKPQKMSRLSGVHAVSSDPIVIVDAQTLLIPNFSYDGEAPDAKFWVGRDTKPSPQGIRIPDENGKETPLRKYDHKTIVLTLPGDLTVFDIGHFGVWCEAFTVDFGHIVIPEITNVPPSLKMLGISPQKRNQELVSSTHAAQTTFSSGNRHTQAGGNKNQKYQDQNTRATTYRPPSRFIGGGVSNLEQQSKLNCEVLYDDLAFEVRWAVAGESIVVQLVAKLEDGEYMSFGLSGDDNHSQMVGSDVTVAWVDKATLKGYAYDYYLDAKSQCAGTRGSCPDDRLAEKTNSVRLLNAAMVNGYSIVTYQRPLRAADELDKAVKPDRSQPIVWAIGPLNSLQEVSYHSHFTKGDRFLDFGRAPAWNCPMPEMDDSHADGNVKNSASRRPLKTTGNQFLVETSGSDFVDTRGQDAFISDDIGDYNNYKDQGTRRTNRPVPTPKPVPHTHAWEIPPIQCNEPDDGVFYAQMGPTGGKQGYPAITGHVGWGISWYINGLLIPEINVVRGKTYTFVTEGGIDSSIPARFHPFYITDDSVGGYEHKTLEERKNINIYAGVTHNRNGDIIPTGVGRLCNWTPDPEGPGPDEFGSFGAYQRSLTLICDNGDPGIITWTPDKNTPDTVYYQCFTHRYLGWKINVLDSCDVVADESKTDEVYEPFSEEEFDVKSSEDLISRPSIRINNRVKPDSNFLLSHEKEISKSQENKNSEETDNKENPSSDGRVIIREIATRPEKDDILTGESISNSFLTNFKNVSPENNPRPDHDFPLSKNQFMQVLDTVERYESKVKNSQDDNRPIYYHSTVSPQLHSSAKNDRINPLEKPLGENEEFKIDTKNLPSHIVLSNNQKPMTLQTFMRPHSKPAMPANMFFRRPMPGDMRLRRPGMIKPGMGGVPRFPPPPHIMVQPMPNVQKKHFFKMPPMNRVPINNMGRPPLIVPMKHNIANENGPKPMFLNNQKIPQQSVIMGKPNFMSQTLTLGQPTLIGQVVKNKTPLPVIKDNVFQQTVSSTYLNKPGQIIMGKPMDNPLPLDQQMIQTKQHIQYTSLHRPATETQRPLNHKYEIVKPVYEVETTSKTSNVITITPSVLINSSPNPSENIVSMRPAVNTGFKPDSVVIEGGFKPIIREPLLSGQDRITDYDSESVTNNRRHDSEEKESAQVEESANVVLNNDFYEKQLTESFEPMFIPSPPDRFQGKNISLPGETTKVIQYVDIRPRPVYKPPESDEQEMEDDDKKIMDDMTMAADRVDAYYLPPNKKNNFLNQKSTDIKLPTGTVVSYDGHTLSDSTLTSSALKNEGKIYSAKLSSNSELLTRFPQFGPFRGEVPSSFSEQANVENKHSMTNSHSLPGSLSPAYNINKNSPKRTKLTLISSLKENEKDITDTEVAASENNEEIIYVDREFEEKKDERVRRNAHHSPDHTDKPTNQENYDHHDHSQHNHSTHNHSQKLNSAATYFPLTVYMLIVPVVALCSLSVWY